MVELGFDVGSNHTPQPKPTSQPTRPYPTPYIPPLSLSAPTLPYLSLPYQTPPHAKPPHPQTISTFTLPCSARHWVKHGMDWNGIEFYHEFFKGTFSFYLHPPPTNKPNRPSDPNSPALDPHPPDHDPLPQTMTPDFDPRH